MIHRIRRQNPHAILIVTGCYAQLKPGEIAKIEGVDFVLGQDEKFRLEEFVEEIESRKSKVESRKTEVFTSPIRESYPRGGGFSRSVQQG